MKDTMKTTKKSIHQCIEAVKGDGENCEDFIINHPLKSPQEVHTGSSSTLLIVRLNKKPQYQEYYISELTDMIIRQPQKFKKARVT